MTTRSSPSVPRGQWSIAAAALAAVLTIASLLVAGSPRASASPVAAATSVVSPSPSAAGSQSPVPTLTLSVTAVTTSSVTVSWTRLAGVASYQLFWRPDFNDVLYPPVELGNVNTYTITELSRGTQYSMSLNARDAQGNLIARSNTLVAVTSVADTGPDTVPPGAPGQLYLTGTDGGWNLAWSPATDNVAVTGYRVYWFDRLFVSQLVTTVSGTSATVQPRTSPVGGYGTFYVRAVDAAGNVSVATNQVGHGVGTPPSVPPVSSAPPPAPTCKVTYRNTAQWTGGFTAELTVTNSSGAPVDGWTLRYTYGGDQRVVSSWAGTHTQDGPDVTLRNARWNGAVAAGGSVTVGVLGTWTTSNAAPTTYALNGARCGIG